MTACYIHKIVFQFFLTAHARKFLEFSAGSCQEIARIFVGNFQNFPWVKVKKTVTLFITST